MKAPPVPLISWNSPLARTRSPAESPLTEVGGEHLVDVDVDATKKRTRIRRGVDHLLVQHCGGFALSMRPGPGLPGPLVPSCGGGADHAVVGRPLASLKMSIDPGSLSAQYRIDTAKPVEGQTVPGVDVDVVVHAEEDRGGVGTSGSGVESQRGVRVRYPTVEPASEIRGRGSARFAVLEVAGDLQTRGA